MHASVKFALAVVLLFARSTTAAPQRRPSSIGAAYLMTNNGQWNSIVAFDITSNGSVVYSRSVSTGGSGGTYGGGLGPDPIRSGNSMVVSGTRLYNANPGSDTISVFDINPDDPTRISLVGQPVNSGGNFPVSIAVSSRSGNVCALNAGAQNGVQCFRPTRFGLAAIPNSNRSLKITGATTPPPSNDSTVNSVSTILFSPSGRKLVVDVKGLADGTPGFLAVWNVNTDGSLSKTFTSFPAPTNAGQQNFGMTHLNGKEGFVMADTTQGGLVYDFTRGYNLSTFVARNIATQGQKITCWASYASKSDTYFFTDAGTEILTEYSIDGSTLETSVVAQYPLPSDVLVLDSAVGTFGENQYLFQLAPIGASLFVLDVQPNGGSSVIHSFNFTESLNNDHIPFNIAMAGIAVYSKHS